MFSNIKSMINNNFINIKKYENKIHFGFFTSKGGVSRGNYKSLNCSINSKDNKNFVKKNINIALKKLKIEKKKLKLINQIHSNKIYLVNNKNIKNEYFGDGIITSNKNLAIGVLTADCAPIFMFDLQNSIICCLHSGWKGSLLNIVEKGVKKLKLNQKIKNTNIVAVVGPCLGSKNFEVNKNFKSKFIKKRKIYGKFFKTKNLNKDLFDLRKMINYQLKKAGVRSIYNINRDTYKYSDIFFSHRRACHQNKTETGRMINIISLKY